MEDSINKSSYLSLALGCNARKRRGIASEAYKLSTLNAYRKPLTKQCAKKLAELVAPLTSRPAGARFK